MHLIAERDHVILRKRGAPDRLCLLQRGQKVHVDRKMRVCLDDAIGHPFGTSFAIRHGRNEHLEPCEAAEANDSGTQAIDMSLGEDTADNRDLHDAGSESQRLTMSDIAGLRAEGRSGQCIVAQLVENSATFHRKTVFSQHKYVTKKVHKHGNVITLCRPNPRLLCALYYERDADRVGCLRVDHLAQALAASNVAAGTRVAVVDQCVGLFVASVLERLAGRGMCVHLHTGDQPQGIPAVAAMNCNDQQLEAYYPVPLSVFFTDQCTGDERRSWPARAGGDDVHQSKGPCNKRKRSPSDDVGDVAVDKEEVRADAPELFAIAAQHTRFPWKLRKNERTQTACQVVSDGQLRAFIVAVQKLDPLPLVSYLVHKVATSSPFVVYCPYMEPLVDCFKWLRDKDIAVNLSLTDSNLRHYQVLPDRTHPEMTQFVAGGFLLTGTTIA